MVVPLSTPAVFESTHLIKLSIMCSQISREVRRREESREGRQRERKKIKRERKGERERKEGRKGGSYFFDY